MNLPGSLHGGLIVSVQARDGSALDDPAVLAALAAAAEENGARAVRVAGPRNLQAVRARVRLPIVGIIKRRYEGFEPYITPTLDEVRQIVDCGAEIVAFDATARSRPGGLDVPEIVASILSAGAVAMADCAQAGDGVRAQAAGAQMVASTLCGYTPSTHGHPLPALDLVRALAGLDAFVVCEGGVHEPAQAMRALEAGAHAVVVGTAITNTEWLVRQYVDALGPQRSSPA